MAQPWLELDAVQSVRQQITANLFGRYLETLSRKNGENRTTFYKNRRVIWDVFILLHADQGYSASFILCDEYTNTLRHVLCTFQPFRAEDGDGLDHYMSLKEMPDALTEVPLLPLQPYARYVLSCLLKDQVFFVLPESSLCAANPRELPREIVTQDDIVAPEKRKGRPARREKGKKARLAVEELDKWLAAEDSQAPSDVDKGIAVYEAAKTAALGDDVETVAMNNSEGEIIRRLAANHGNSED